MAKYAASILTIAGAIVGGYFGGPTGAALGASLGGLIGGLVFPQNTTSVGPRLADTGATVSNVGAPIPRGWGTFPAGGCIIVQTNLQEVNETTTTGGKGGPSNTTETPTYFQTFAIGINDGLIGGVRVIWANGKPIFDLRPQGNAASSDNSIFLTSPEPGSNVTETDAQYKARIVASQQLAAKFTLYLGTEDQMPDPGLEAFYGVGNISAFRGLAYIVFHDWQNKAEDGNRMPSQWKFEVYTSASEAVGNASLYRNEVVYPWLAGSDPTNLCNVNSFIPFGGPGFSSEGPFDTALDCIGAATGNVLPLLYIDYQVAAVPSSEIATSMTGGPVATDPPFADATSMILHFNEQYPGVFGPTAAMINDDVGPVLIALGGTASYRAPMYLWWTSADVGADIGVVYGLSGVTDPGDGSGNYGGLGGVAFYAQARANGWNNIIAVALGGGAIEYVYLAYDYGVQVTRSPAPPKTVVIDDGAGNLTAPPCVEIATPVPGLEGWGVSGGELVQAGAWTKYTTSGSPCLVLQAYSTGTVSFDCPAGTESLQIVGAYPRDPALPDGHDDYYNEAFWTDAYHQAVIQGMIAGGKVYVSGGSVTNDSGEYPHRQSYIYEKAVSLTSQATGVANVAEIFLDICEEAGLTSADVDVTALEDLNVIGYVRTNVMSARDALTPLTQALFFNAIESNAKIACRLLGSSIVRTLTTDDLGAVVVDSSGGGQQTPAMTGVDMQDVDLPRSVRVHYLSQSRDYDSGEQDSPYRVSTESVNDVDITLPIVLNDSHALQIAQAIWAQQWAGRITYSTTIDAQLQELEPVDAIAAPVDGFTERMRITGISDALPATRALTMVSDDQQSYTSYAVASSVPPVIRPIPIVTPAQVILLDTPLLRDKDNDSGFYSAMFGLLPDSFKSAALYRSTDGGGNFTRLISASSSAITGVLSHALPTAKPEVIDYASTLYVQLYDKADTLNSATLDSVLGGSNAAAIGADGRWEIIQFITATHQVGSIYALSGLIRGRRGTEWAIGTSQAGDSFVLLSSVIRTPLDLTLVNKPYTYKPVGAGSTLDEAISVSFTGRGVALKPFSPCFLRATKTNDGDWTITWIRRGRIGQTLQSGVDVPLSETTEDYEVDILNSAGSVLRTISTSTQSALYSHQQQITDGGAISAVLHVNIYQISAQVGRGYGTSGSFNIANTVVSGTVVSQAVVTFGGTPGATEDWAVEFSYAPNVGGASTYYLFNVNAGSSPNDVAERAADLAAQIAASGLNAHVTISHVGGMVTVRSSTGVLNALSQLNAPYGTGPCGYPPGYNWAGNSTSFRVQEAGPSTSTTQGLYGVDLYDSIGGTLGPASSSAFNVAGTYIKKFKAKAIDPTDNIAFIIAHSPLVQLGDVDYCEMQQDIEAEVVWFLPTFAGGGNRSIVQLFNNDGTGAGIDHAITTHPLLSTVVDTVSITGGRPCVQISMKPGWELIDDGNNTFFGDGEPSGYVAETSTLTTPIRAYTGSGKPQIDESGWKFALAPLSGSALTPLCELDTSQTFRLTVNGVNYDHVVTSGDVADTSPYGDTLPQFFDGIYNDLAAQLVATGLYDVGICLLGGRPGSPDTWANGITVTDKTANVSYDFTPTVLPTAGMTVGIVISTVTT